METALSTSHRAELDQYFRKFERLLPSWACRAVHWLRRPSSFYARILVALLLIVGGFLSFLPILGFWMLPLGLIFIAQDIPILQPPLIRALKWCEAKFIKRTETKQIENKRTEGQVR